MNFGLNIARGGPRWFKAFGSGTEESPNIIGVAMTDTDGNASDISLNPNTSDYELLVSLKGTICEENSTSVNLDADAVFLGDWQDTLEYGSILVSTISDQDSATDGLTVQFSSDMSTVHDADVFTLLANIGKTFSFQPVRRYIRIQYTNGGVTQTSFNLETSLRRVYVKPSSHRIQDSIVAEDDAELVKAVLTGLTPAGTFENVNVTNGQNLKISIEEFETDVSTNSNTQLRTTLYDEDGTPASVDASTGALVTMTQEHHEIHEGDHYGLDSFVTIPINNVYDIQIVTADTVKEPHMVFSVNCQAETLVEFYEGVTINLAGASMSAFNNNRRSVNTAETTFAGIANTSTANANTDTAIAGFTMKRDGIIGAGRTGGSGSREDEIILKRNTAYTLRFTANAAGYTDYHIAFYEDTPKNL